MYKNNPRRDVHMYQKNQMQKFYFCDYNFWGL
jgi:hypothetical protein